MNDPFFTYGPPELCTWRYGHGICRFQTTSPRIARKLSQRRGVGLVAWSVTNNYLRIFEEKMEPWRARLLVTRYLKPTNGGFLSNTSPPKLRRRPSSVVTVPSEKNPFLVNYEAKTHQRRYSHSSSPKSKSQARLNNAYGCFA